MNGFHHPEPRMEEFHRYQSKIDASHQQEEFFPRRQFLGEYHADFQQQHHLDTRNGRFQYHPSRHDGWQ
jgi:hypothetical protein